MSKKQKKLKATGRRPQPMQPVIVDGDGTRRFQSNQIVRQLLDFASSRGMSLNDIARMGFLREDREQFAQLIGYSLSGFSDLSYASNESVAVAEADDGKKSEAERAAETLRETLRVTRVGMREAIAMLYRVHPDDLNVDG